MKGKRKPTITVRVWRGIVSEVKGIPKGVRVVVIDTDNQDGGKPERTVYEA